ncbi:MAG: hypothetical protein E6344_02705 [Clostridium sp.]|uniref:hypothetical protein n=1 Tax=Clostridium culturomicium TaxID=1499683 RepID=UPI0018CE2E7B|nr:hypothetical protein [Clostridium culturomicium]MDU4892183.1 hypothetical protein [Clostridium sp.]MDU7082570.1 hypothetical protein [Clostridium sp.]
MKFSSFWTLWNNTCKAADNQISEYVYVEEFSVSKVGNRDIIKAGFKIDLVYGLYIPASEKVDLDAIEVWE